MAAARRICCTAFGTLLSAPEPENFWDDSDYVYGRFGAEHVASFAVELEGELVGSCGLGDTLLLWARTSRLAGFAVRHWRPASEAGEGCCFVKFGAARSGPTADDHFAGLLDA